MSVISDPCPTCTGPLIERVHTGRNARGEVFAVWTQFVCVNGGAAHVPEDWNPAHRPT
jgi:hypothetical protein